MISKNFTPENFHVDLMDGHYVPNLCFPLRVISDLKKKYPDCTVDVHMMVDNPANYIEKVAKEGADYICFHQDSTPYVRRLLSEIRKCSKKAGVVLNPSQRVDVIEPVLPYLDLVLLMSVEPGFAGQRFLDGSMERLKELNALRKKGGYDFQISLDGGVHYGILEECIQNGADIIVTTVYTIFQQPEGIRTACRKFDEFVKKVKRTEM